jgi:hypothetical protein
MVSVREVKSGNTETFVDQILEHGDIPASRSQSADDFRLTVRSVGLLHNLLQGNVRSSEFRASTSKVGLRLHGYSWCLLEEELRNLKS